MMLSQRSKGKVRRIRFVGADLRFFDVINEFKDVVYSGCIDGTKPSIGDNCNCDGWTFRTTEAFMEKHKHTYQCRHIRDARKQRFEGHPC